MLGRSLAWAMLVSEALIIGGCGCGGGPEISFTPTPVQPQPTVTPYALSSTVPSSAAATVRPTASPTVRPTVSPMVTTAIPSANEPTPTKEECGEVTFTVVYDNNDYDASLKKAWGFACLVDTGEANVLFDTGGDAPTLLDNMVQLDVDPQAMDVVVLSHIHGDHTGGLAGLLDTGARPVVYVPAAFPASFKESVRARTELVEVTGPVKVVPGVYTTGEVGSEIVEQGLVVEIDDGLVVITGCAHPGITEMVSRAQEVWGREVVFVMGGFHLRSASQEQIESIITDLRQAGVQWVAPCHCTGDVAREMFAQAFDEGYFPTGVGREIAIELRTEG